MPREMFREVVDPAPRLGSRSRLAVPVSMIGHAVFAALAIIAPLMAADVLPDLRTTIPVFTAPKALPAPPAPPPARSPVTSSKPAAPGPVAPSEAPGEITPEKESTGSAIPHEGGVPGGLPAGVIGSISVVPGVPVLPPPPPVTQPVPVGGRIKAPAKVRHVPPVYPAIAQQARVEGVVIIEAIIGVDGRVSAARVLKSKPLLDDAALAAVRQWEFSPTMLNGVPVPVIMTVTVNFTLR